MSTNRIAIVMLFAFFAVGRCTAQTEVPKIAGNLDIMNIKSMQIFTNAGYVLILKATFTNKNPEALRLRNGEFDVTFDKPDGGKIDVGPTKIVDQTVPGNGSALVTLSVAVGPQSPETFNKLIQVVNIVGNPANTPHIGIQGRSEVGMQLPRGWVYEQGRKFEVDLSFTPAIQREVLFK